MDKELEINNLVKDSLKKKDESVDYSMNDRVDFLESVMAENFPLVHCPLNHRFTKGLYIREIFMPAGSLITSKIHKTQHQYFVLKGAVSVWIDGGEEHYIEAPYIGITEPGTRRILYVWEDCIWATAHPNPDDEDLEQIEERIIEKHDNPLLMEEFKQKQKELTSFNNKTLKL
jgi:hypothetical protein